MALARLDHVIFHVPDIRSAHAALAESFPEAWPIGPFWPNCLTSGIALGGMNLELMEAVGEPVEHSLGTTLAFEPLSLPAAEIAFTKAGIPYEIDLKIEPDPKLLRMRGFDGDTAKSPQIICRNVLPKEGQSQPLEFFVCDYAPFLKAWLAPGHPRLQSDSRVLRVIYGTPEPIRAQNLLLQLGYAGEIAIDFTCSEARQILRIETAAGPVNL